MATPSLMMAECKAAIAASKEPVALDATQGLRYAYQLKIQIGALSQEISDRHFKLDLELSETHDRIAQLTADKDRILQEYAEAGRITDDGYRIDVQTKKQNGKLDLEKMISLYPKIYDKLKTRALEDLDESYSPTLGDVRREIKKIKQDPEEVITPGQTAVIGYDVVPDEAEMPEQGSKEVEL